MGYHTYQPARTPDGKLIPPLSSGPASDVALSRLHNRGAARTHAALRLHPNFVFPDFPQRGGQIALANFILESVARFVSPPKIKGEDEEFACEDIADAIRTRLGPEIIAMLKRART